MARQKLAFADLKIKDKTFLLFEGKGTENLIEYAMTSSILW